MAKFLLKRGLSSNITSVTLDAGEPAYTTDSKKMYIGNADGTKTLINPDQAALTADDIPILPVTKITGLGTAATKNTGNASGNVPVLGTDGKLDAAMLPPLAITDTFVVESQTAMLALINTETGDVAVRTDLNKSFILKQSPASTLANWVELLTPDCEIQSVNGKTGTVVMNAADVGAEPVIAPDTSDKYLNGAKEWTDFATSVRAAVLTGLSTSSNSAVSATDTILAAIGKLQAQLSSRLTSDSIIDGGTF